MYPHYTASTKNMIQLFPIKLPKFVQKSRKFRQPLGLIRFIQRDATCGNYNRNTSKSIKSNPILVLNFDTSLLLPRLVGITKQAYFKILHL